MARWTAADLQATLQQSDVEIGNPEILYQSSEQTQQYIQAEADLQRRIFDECALRALSNPAWEMIYAIPNGQYRKGQRMEPGLKKGVPDIHVPLIRRGYAGFYIELKHGKNQPSTEQVGWMDRLKEQGYMVSVHREFENCMGELEWYVEWGE